MNNTAKIKAVLKAIPSFLKYPNRTIRYGIYRKMRRCSIVQDEIISIVTMKIPNPKFQFILQRPDFPQVKIKVIISTITDDILVKIPAVKGL